MFFTLCQMVSVTVFAVLLKYNNTVWYKIPGGHMHGFLATTAILHYEITGKGAWRLQVPALRLLLFNSVKIKSVQIYINAG